MRVSSYSPASMRYHLKMTGFLWLILEFVVVALMRPPALEITMAVFVTVGMIIAAIRVWGLAAKNSVTITGESITWASPKQAVKMGWAAASGTVPWASVSGLSVITQNRTLAGNPPVPSIRVIRIEGEDGGEFILPLWTPGTATRPEFTALLQALQDSKPETLVLETSILKPVD